MSESRVPHLIHRQDYTPPPYLVDTVELRFDLVAEATTVSSRLVIRRNPELAGDAGPLVLAGRRLLLKEVRLDGRPLVPPEYLLDEESLTIPGPPGAFVLETEVEINPLGNTALEGLYQSSGNFCTQCEAEGFRKITFHPDRPDVLSRYTVTLAADRERYPVLLSNGNLVKEGALDGGRHFAVWEDPFPKPSYLFALVAGDLVRIADGFTTASGREVALHLYVEQRNADKCEHAMRSLKKAMTWDEETFGLEYDLDIYMIVAVDDFNMGAMENKGLNVFNSKYVLARPDTATDADYQGIEGVIGHEYFHNWTGNRVTCRDWFQLSLKEGLTVFRDQEFSADMTSRAVKRIEEVRMLRNGQFPEDAGPMAHPVRPDSYAEINNFYTMTVYNKGAEVIRMVRTLIGAEAFRRGLTLYLERNDGKAATVEDFLSAMAEAGGVDLSRFALWYSQAGTPLLEAEGAWDGEAGSYALTLRQSCPPTPGQPKKRPFHIPLALGLLDRQGNSLPLQLEGEAEPTPGPTRVLELLREEERFTFVGLSAEPVPSLLRNFSAPVRLRFPYAEADLAFLMARDADPFNRWEAGQQLGSGILLRLVADQQAGRPLVLEPLFVEACRHLLLDGESDPALRALALTLPTETYLAEQMAVVDPEAISVVRRFARRDLGRQLRRELLDVYLGCRGEGPYSIEPQAVGRRSLKNLALFLLSTLGEEESLELCRSQYRRGENMTDVLAALSALSELDHPARAEALEDFYGRWKSDPLVLDKWFSLQATAGRPTVLEEVRTLLGHPAFSLRNPNKVRALLGGFAHGNPAGFHRADGEGYAFIGDQVLALDRINPQVTARLVGAFSRWRRYDPSRQALMRGQLERIAAAEGLSRDVSEVVHKSLA